MLDDRESAQALTREDDRRWGQLTYTSFDPGNGASGGWQIKETTGGLSTDEIESLRSRIVTWFDALNPLSAFPSPAELEVMPRRLTYVADEQGRGTYWHSVMAGRDSTGRPGNVFSHVVLDRAVDAPNPEIRPIELWRSPDLICPYGPDQVMEAVLTSADRPRFGYVLDRHAVLDFLFDPAAWRVGVLSVLLDAVGAAMKGGPPVVLLTDSAESGARWIAALSSLTSARMARALSFSVYERASGLSGLFERGVHVACVPREDINSLTPSRDLVIVDEHEMPSLGEVGGQQHETLAGSRITPSPWSELAQAALVDRSTAAAALAELDEVSSRIGDPKLEPCWPLAMAAMRLPHLFEDLQAEAAVAVKRHSPHSLADDAELLALAMLTVRREGGETASDAWAELQHDEVSPLMRDSLIQVYLERALSDMGWAKGAGPMPLPLDFRPEFVNAELRGSAFKALTEVSKGLSTVSDNALLNGAFRLLDFLSRAAIVGVRGSGGGVMDDPLDEAAADIIERVVTAVVDDDHLCQELAADAGELSSDWLGRAVLDAVKRTDRFNRAIPGERVPAAFRPWLLWCIPSSDFDAFLREPTEDVPALLGEAAIWQSQTGAAKAGSSRTVAALALLQGPDVEPRQASWDAVFDPAREWLVGELLELEQRHPCRAPGSILLRTLTHAVRSPELDSLVTLILRKRGSDEVTGPEVSLAELRSLAARAWTGTTYLTPSELATTLLELAHLAREYAAQGDLPAEVGDAVLVSAIISLGESDETRRWSPLIDGFFREYQATADSNAATILEQLVDRNSFDELALRRIVTAAAEAAPGYPHATHAHPLSAVVLSSPHGPVKLLEVPVRRVLAGRRSRHELLDYLLTRELNIAMTGASEHRGDERRAEKVYEDRERFLRSWWQSLSLDTYSDVGDNPKPAFFGVFKSSNRKDR